jgi:hypothetical protein
LGIPPIQRMGQGSLRPHLRQTKDSQEESRGGIGSKDRGARLGHVA